MIVVADTSVLVNLCCVGQGGLLVSLFGDVVIPPVVAREFERLVAAMPRFAGLSFLDGIRQQEPSTVPESIRASAGLDPGESAALALALEIHADAVLVDERRGYEVARQVGLEAIGVLGILLRAKSAGCIPLVQPILDALQADAGFWVSDRLRSEILQLAGEA